jgi:hypothetical protein
MQSTGWAIGRRRSARDGVREQLLGLTPRSERPRTRNTASPATRPTTGGGTPWPGTGYGGARCTPRRHVCSPEPVLVRDGELAGSPRASECGGCAREPGRVETGGEIKESVELLNEGDADWQPWLILHGGHGVSGAEKWDHCSLKRHGLVTIDDLLRVYTDHVIDQGGLAERAEPRCNPPARSSCSPSEGRGAKFQAVVPVTHVPIPPDGLQCAKIRTL